MDLLRATHAAHDLHNVLAANKAKLDGLVSAANVPDAAPDDDYDTEAIAGMFDARGQVISSWSDGSARTIDVPQNGVVRRRGPVILGAEKCKSSHVFGRLTSGDLAFHATDDWGDSCGAVFNKSWPYETIAGSTSYVCDGLSTVGILDGTSGSPAIVLPVPRNDAVYVYFISDAFAEIVGGRSPNEPVVGPTTGQINGSSSITLTTTRGLWMFVGYNPFGTQAWIAKEL